MRYFLRLAYNGTRFCGWQIQPHSPSIQESIETVLTKLLQESISIVGAGRTDSGVHATEYYAHFDTQQTIDTEQLVYKLNRMLPSDIVVYYAFEVTQEMHARFSAISRTYVYTITQEKNPFAQETMWYFPTKLDVALMNDACQHLLGTQDFTSFSKLHTDVNNNICTITEAFWQQEGNQLRFQISANRFLRNMVRSIVGTLIDVGLHKVDIQTFSNIIKSKNRQNAGQSVAACGLSLTKIDYEESFR